MRTVIQLLKDAARDYGEHSYLTGKSDKGWTDVNFTETDRISDSVAAWWLNMGIGRGDQRVTNAKGHRYRIRCNHVVNMLC